MFVLIDSKKLTCSRFFLCVLMLLSPHLYSSIGAGFVVDGLRIPSTFSSLLYNPLCPLLFSRSDVSPVDWHLYNVSYSDLAVAISASSSRGATLSFPFSSGSGAPLTNKSLLCTCQPPVPLFHWLDMSS